MLLSEWVAHTPPEVLEKNFGVSRQTLATLPTGSLYIFPGTVPANTVAQDKAEIGGSAVASPSQYTFKLKPMAPTRSTKGGAVRIVDSGNFPVSTHFSAALVTIKPGGMRELHWHPNAAEWQFWIAGKGRMTVFSRSITPAPLTFTRTTLAMSLPTPVTISRTPGTPTSFS